MDRRKFLKMGGASAALLAMGSNPINAIAKKKKKAKKKAKKKGSRKRVSQLFLREVTGTEAGQGSPGSGGIAGWAIPVVSTNKQLIVIVHLNDGEPETDYDVIVIINGESYEEDMGVLSTDGIGDGNTLMVLEMMDYPQSLGTINVQVEVKGSDDVYASATVPISYPRTRKKKKKKAKK